MARAPMGDPASPPLDAAPAADDTLYIRDADDTTDDANGTVKEITTTRLFEAQVGIVSQVEAEAGTATTARRWTAERVKQLAAALFPSVTLAGTPDYITLAGQVLTRALINLTTHVTGILPVANGGTGVNTLPSGQLVTGAGTGTVTGTAIPAGGLAGIGAKVSVTGDVTLDDTHLGDTLVHESLTPHYVTVPATITGETNLSRIELVRGVGQATPIVVGALTDSNGVQFEQPGHNRLLHGGRCTLERTGDADRITRVNGPLIRGTRPNSTDFASVVDVLDLRRGEGLTIEADGRVSAWASSSLGVGTLTLVQATDGNRPRSVDQYGGVVIDRVTTPGTAMNLAVAHAPSAGQLLYGLAFKIIDPNAGKTWEPLTLNASGFGIRHFINAAISSNTYARSITGWITTGTTFVEQYTRMEFTDYLAVVGYVDRVNAVAGTLASVARQTTTFKWSTGITAGDWAAQSLTLRLGDSSTSSTRDCSYAIYAASLFSPGTLGTTETVIRDAMERLLADLWIQLPVRS